MILRAASLMVLLTLSACGFHLRGHDAYTLPFQTLYVQSAKGYTPFVRELSDTVAANGVKITGTADEAQLMLDVVAETEDKQILSLSGGGRVREYRLLYRVSLRAYDGKQRDWIPPSEIALQRDFSYDDTQVLAKEQEEALLYQNMRSDAVRQVLRRLNHAKAPQ